MSLSRFLKKQIIKDLEHKMVFIGGARQVGKTTLSKQIAHEVAKGNYAYYNWDFDEDRVKIAQGQVFGAQEFLIFDELHKMENWKNWIKGVHDKYKNKYQIIVTGSARLDIYSKGGDSLFGRNFYHLLSPLTFAEIQGISDTVEPFEKLQFKPTKDNDTLDKLMKFGGFPEPFLSDDEQFWKRWKNMRKTRIVKEDIRDIQDINKISKMQVLLDLLPDKVGSLFSARSLSGDIETSHNTIKEWVELFANFYLVFKIHPFRATKIKSLRKAPKIYMWDWREVEDISARFENLLAAHLQSFVSYYNHSLGEDLKLHFLRDKEAREVDFAVSARGKVWFVVEAKVNNRSISKNLKYFVEREEIKQAYQVVMEKDVDFIKDGIHVISADLFLSGLV